MVMVVQLQWAEVVAGAVRQNTQVQEYHLMAAEHAHSMAAEVQALQIRVAEVVEAETLMVLGVAAAAVS
jgi:hypothetical protein